MDEKKGCIFNIQRFSIHDGPGIRTSIFFKGCPLCCTWCANPESQNKRPEPIWDNVKKKKIITGDYYTVEEVMEIIRKDKAYYEESDGGVTVTGGEVLTQKSFVVDLLRACKEEGFHTTCETCAFGPVSEFRELIENVDLLIMDVKHYDTVKHRLSTGGPLEPVLRNLDHAVSVNKKMLVRIPIIPDFNNSLKDAKNFGKLLQEHQVKKIELLPFHQFGKSKYKYLDRDYQYQDYVQLNSEDLIPFAEIIRSYDMECLIA